MSNNSKNRASDPEGIQRWRDRTPEIVQTAIMDCFWDRGSDQQKRLLKNWVHASVMNLPLSAEILLADLASRPACSSILPASQDSGCSPTPTDSSGTSEPSGSGAETG